MSNDDARHLFADAFSLLQDQMREMAEVQGKRAALTAKGTAADGAVEVTVDARGVVSGVTVDESYLDDHELEELGGFVTTAAQAASRDMEQQAEAVFAPLVERRKAITGLAASITDAPDFGEALSALTSWSADAGTPPASSGEDREDDPLFPTVRE